MPHIIILDEHGNEIGREEHEAGGASAAETEDHEPKIVRMDLAKVGELLGVKDKKENDGG